MRRRGTQARLGEEMEKTLRQLDRKNEGAYTAARAISAWRDVAGESMSKHTTGAHLRGRELVVYVDNHVWAAEYTAMAERYRTAVNQALGQELVSGLRFVVSRRVAEEHRIQEAERDTEQFYAEDDVASIPLTEVELAQVKMSVAEIPDAELREAVLRATVKDLEWKKGLSARNAAQNGREAL